MKHYPRKSSTGRKSYYALCGMVALCLPAAVEAATSADMNYGSMETLFGEPVTTSATGTPQRASDVPADMTIITADDVRRAGARNIPQIIGMYVPGIDVLQESINSFDVGVRGYQQLQQPAMLVLVDGRQVFIDDYSRTAWNNIPVNIDDIRQIEVVKGASSALFGSNAAAGVINIVTYSPLYDHNNVINGTAGTQSTYSGDATVTRNGDWGGTKFSVGGMSSHEFDTARNPVTDQVPAYGPMRQYATNSSVFPLAPDVKAFTEFTYSRSVENLIDPLDFIALGEALTTYSLRAGADWKSPYGYIKLDNYFNHSLSDDAAAPLPGPVRFDTNMFVSQLQDEFQAGTSNTFRITAEYRHKNFATGDLQAVAQSSNLAQDIFSFGGSWLWQVTDKLSWTNAARIDREQMNEAGTLAPSDVFTNADYSHINNAWSANSDIVYKATDKDTLRAGYGRGIEFPSLLESGYDNAIVFAGIPVDTEGNPHLNPIVTQDFSIGYERKLESLYSTAKAEAFYQLEQDVIGVQALGFDSLGFPAFSFANYGDSHAWGGELSLKGSSPSGVRWAGSYSLAKVVDDQAVASSAGIQGNAPEHHFRLSAGYTSGPWEMDAFAQYVSSTGIKRSYDNFTSAPVHIDGYATVNGRVGYSITPNIVVALTGVMLNHAELATTPYPGSERQILLGVTGRF